MKKRNFKITCLMLAIIMMVLAMTSTVIAVDRTSDNFTGKVVDNMDCCEEDDEEQTRGWPWTNCTNIFGHSWAALNPNQKMIMYNQGPNEWYCFWDIEYNMNRYCTRTNCIAKDYNSATMINQLTHSGALGSRCSRCGWAKIGG